ncbi:MAG TPA: CPBP family intramembrane glutamic endopeptidase [Ornithinibacter sp.]|nr:CPBP family intramembrane glutamic endopeptidase [Ornithinibacter sp.]
MNESQVVALVACLAIVVATNVWLHVGPARWQPVAGPAVAGLLLLVGRLAGLSWAQLGLGEGSVVRGLVWGGAAVACVALVYAVGVALPVTRGLFRDERHRVAPRSAIHRAGLVVPLATVTVEEVAFRGVLWGLLEVAHGAVWATGVTAVLFGVWHVLPAIDGARANSPTGRLARTDLLGRVGGTVAFTVVAGAVFGVLREQSGSLIAPALLHWAANGLGILAAALAWRSAPPR